jgi:LAS superfamily LD-carboxypeptidase LdcB
MAMHRSRLRPHRRALLALVVSVVLVPVPGVPSTAQAVGRLPECRLEDVMTVPRGYDDWSVTLVDWMLRVPRDYVPPDLVPVSEAGIAGPGLIREVAIDDLRALARAAAANGTPIAVNSPYRSYREQVASFNGWVAVDGFDDAITYSQRPGHSEHQLGLTIDFQALGGPSALQGDWATTPTGSWMIENSWRYGWVLSYPLGEGGALFSDATCFHYEPWHYRYLGREIARKVHRSGLTIREYLWKHHTQLDTNLERVATPTPTPSPTAAPTATPTAAPSGPASDAPVPGTPSPTPDVAGPTSVDRWLGLEPIVAIGIGALLLVVLASIAFVARRGFARS